MYIDLKDLFKLIGSRIVLLNKYIYMKLDTSNMIKVITMYVPF